MIIVSKEAIEKFEEIRLKTKYIIVINLHIRIKKIRV